MLVVFGLNKDLWNKLGADERAQYNWAARLYLLSCVLSAAAGVRFMQQLSDSYTIGIFGGLLVGYIVSVVTRIALITMVSLPLLPEKLPVTASNVDIQMSAAALSKLNSLRALMPDFSIIFRLLIITLMALTIAMPVASFLVYNEAENISAMRRAEVVEEFKANHPDMTSEQNRILLANLQADHFPISVYRTLAHQSIGIFSLGLTGACFLIPFFILWNLRRSDRFQYARWNQELMVKQIESEYAFALEQSKHIQQKRFGLTECVMPNGAWLDAPFNTRSISEQTKYSLETEVAFIESLKTL